MDLLFLAAIYKKIKLILENYASRKITQNKKKLEYPKNLQINFTCTYAFHFDTSLGKKVCICKEIFLPDVLDYLFTIGNFALKSVNFNKLGLPASSMNKNTYLLDK